MYLAHDILALIAYAQNPPLNAHADVSSLTHVRIQRGGQGVQTPPEKSQNIGFLSNFFLDPLKKSQRYQANIQCWVIISMPAKRHLNGVSLTGRCWPAYSGIWIFPPLINLKNPVKVGPPLTKFSGSAHVARLLLA